MFVGSPLPIISIALSGLKKRKSNEYSRPDIDNMGSNVSRREKKINKINNKLNRIIDDPDTKDRYIRLCRVDKYLDDYLHAITSILSDSDMLFKIKIRSFLAVTSSIYIKFYERETYTAKIFDKFETFVHNINCDTDRFVIKDKITYRNKILAETIARNYNMVLHDTGYTFGFKEYIRKVFVVDSYTVFHEYCVYAMVMYKN
ncbi:hypothetical protein QKC54_gp0541 [Megavirus baoshan]|uniref:Uncharacterized protein n=1 Tax=Megavirus baoshan TaxID=2496520 RepID=A0A3S8UWV0_9VIRU|nr:hypothetical protein QKC54_gp0541 [Megavirus baoshan]AZL89290.1 hypothetical protein Mb0531 [Megavirus baoshan]